MKRVDGNNALPTPRHRWLTSSAPYQRALIGVTVAYLSVAIATSPRSFGRPELAAWFVALVVVSLLAVPGPRGLRLGLDFALSIAVAILYGPAPAALVTFAGSFDEREL